jgi:hypothetical protein
LKDGQVLESSTGLGKILKLIKSKTVPYYYFSFKDWSHLDKEIGEALLLWVYKDELKVPNNKLDFLMNMLRAAGQYKLIDLLNWWVVHFIFML